MRRHRLLVFLAAVFAAKLLVVLQLRDHPLLRADPGFESAVYVAPHPALFLVPSVYMSFVALVLGAVKVVAAVRIAQIVLGTAAIAGIFAATRVWFGDRAAWIAAVLAAFTGLFTFYETTILPSALDPFLSSALLAALAEGLVRRKVWLAVAGVALVLLLLNRPALMHGGLHFYIGNNATSDGTYRPVTGIAADDPSQQREDARRVAEASSGRTLDDRGVSAYFYGLGRSWIRLHPDAAALHFARKLALVFNAGHIAANYSYPFYAYDMVTLLAVLFVGPWLLLPLGLTGLLIGAIRLRPREYLIWVSFVPLYALAVAIFFVTERARLPLLVPMCIGAGAALDFVTSRKSRAVRTSAVAGAFVAIGALVFVTNRSMPRDDGRAEERTRMAEAMIVRDRVDLAEQWAADAAAIHPHPADVHLRVGRRLVVHSRPEAAMVHLERAQQLDPSSADVSFAMGQALIQARRPREAVPLLRSALKGGVRESLVGYELARALAASGDRAGALQTLQGIRPEDPSDADAWNALGQLASQLESPSLATAFFNGAARARQLRQGAK